MDLKAYPNLRPFLAHGIVFTGERDAQVFGECPFTGKADKFYVNRDTGLWDSKSSGQSGNIPQFLAALHAYHLEVDTDDEVLEALAEHRGLTLAAIKAWQIAFNGTDYLLPIYDPTKRLMDLRRYNVQKKILMSTAGMHTCLYGAHLLSKRPTDPIYLCEGEWDTIAMHYLLRKNKAAGLAVGVPGAGTFKPEWVTWLTGRRVHTLYDHDEAGRAGELLARKRLQSSVKAMTYVHWPEELPSGFDTRDWIVYGLKKQTLHECLRRLHLLFRETPRREPVSDAAPDASKMDGASQVARLVQSRRTIRPTLAQLYQTYHRWLKLENTDAIDIAIGTYITQRMAGIPVWTFLVGPPGSLKTILIIALSAHTDGSYLTSSLTPPALISGASQSQNQNGGDPSLIPRLNGKVLLIKDLTTVLQMRQIDRDEIFGILRDAYDGKCGKVFGNGVERNYESKFTIISGVTPVIHSLGHEHAALGERFLKFSVSDNLVRDNEEDVIMRAISNVDHDLQMMAELKQITADFIGETLVYPEDTEDWPHPDNAMKKRIVALSRYGARLRGTVTRDRYTQMMTGKPFTEVGSRLGMQLDKLARALALMHGHTSVTDEEYRLIKRVMRDTLSQRNEEILRALWAHGEPATKTEIAQRTCYSADTVRYVMDDMAVLGTVSRAEVQTRDADHRLAKRIVYACTPTFLRFIDESDVYRPETEQPVPIIRLRRRA